MNTSYRGSGDAAAILTWLKQYPYPHCKAAGNLAALRTGNSPLTQESLSLRF